MAHIGRKIGLAVSAAALPALLLAPMTAEARGWHRSYHPAPRYYHHSHGGDGLAAGLLGAGIGIIIGSAIASQNQPRERVVVRERVITRDSGWVNPDYPPVYAAPASNGWYQPATPVSAPVQPQSSCLQTREYQTKITVGGKEVDAYGTACLQPDGDWQFGAPTPVPQ